MKIMSVVIGILAAVWLSCASGQGAQAPPEWAGLTAEQRAVLRNIEKDWATLPGERRGQFVAGANRWLAMSPDERSAARERFALWQSLPPDRRCDRSGRSSTTDRNRSGRPNRSSSARDRLTLAP